VNDPTVSEDKPQADQTSNRDLLDRLIFEQDLNEVHLLIDFISGRADRSITTLTMPNPIKPGETLTAGEIVEAITTMRYPPQGGDAVNAANAAILLMAKDKLSSLAAPARGLTIAYTAMFIDAEVKTWPARLWEAFARRDIRKTKPLSDTANRTTTIERPAGAHDPDQDTRVDLAVRTFPVLQSHARRFRRWRDGLAGLALVWLLLTALAYWDAGLGRASLERLDQNWKGFTEELRDSPVLLNCDANQLAATRTLTDVKAVEEAARAELACRRHEYNRWKGEAAVKEVRSVFGCDGMGPLTRLVHVWCWHWLLTGNNPVQLANSATDAAKASATSTPVQDTSKEPAQVAPPQRQPTQEIKDNATYWQTATSVLSVFTTYILPMLFALLGTLIGAFRAILNRIANSELAPRDFVRMLLGIPTGLVAGIAVGLFLSPSSVPVQGSGSVAGQLTLTASGLGFLAGYASQSFFTYLDNVMGTVFPNTADTNVPAPRPAANLRT
jgi:hypothetical protein